MLLNDVRNLHDAYTAIKRVMKIIDKPIALQGEFNARSQRERFTQRHVENGLLLSSRLVSEQDGYKEYEEFYLSRGGCGLSVSKVVYEPDEDGNSEVTADVRTVELAAIAEAVGLSECMEVIRAAVGHALDSANHKADNLEYALKRLEAM